MQKIKLLFALLFVCSLTACFEIEEKIDINANDSGTYTVNIDMSKMMQMMEALKSMKSESADSTATPLNESDSIAAPDNIGSGEKKSQDIDSIIYFKPIVDTARNLTAAEKEMMRDGSMHILVNEKAGKVLLTLNLPFKKTAQLPYIRSNFPTVMDKLGVMDKKENTEDNMASMGSKESSKTMSKSISPMGDFTRFTTAKGLISNKIIDKVKMKAQLKKDPSFKMLQEMGKTMGDISYTTIINLPAPAKMIKGPAATLSAGKRRVTIRSNLNDIIKKPENFEYEIRY
jgi:hypothetical protein